MERLNPDKLHVEYLAGVTPEDFILPRRYTLTHSDITGRLFLSIGSRYETKRTSRLYTRLMRDEILAELTDDAECYVMRVYCHVSGGFVLGTARWRYNIFQHELPIVLETLRYGDRVLFEQNPHLDDTPVSVHFKSTDARFNRVESWCTMADYG